MSFGRELNGHRKDGSEFPVEISLTPFSENGEHFVDAFVADLSQHKRIDALQRQSEAHLTLLMQTNPNGLLVLDETGRIKMTNHALDTMFGYTAGELLDQPVETLVLVASRSDYIRLHEEYLEHPVIRTMGAGLDLSGCRKNGGTFSIEVSLASFEEDGRKIVQATVVDHSGQTAA
jgi:PAS domain S-box-containing protein